MCVCVCVCSTLLPSFARYCGHRHKGREHHAEYQEDEKSEDGLQPVSRCLQMKLSSRFQTHKKQMAGLSGAANFLGLGGSMVLMRRCVMHMEDTDTKRNRIKYHIHIYNQSKTDSDNEYV